MPPAPPVERLDVTGTLCPVPILLAARAAARLPPGARLELVGDDPALVIDLPAWCDETGHRLLALRREGRLIHGVVELAAPPAGDP